jgi:hypothetical protein
MSEYDDLTSTLTRELEDRAHTMDGALLHVSDVRGRARSIRRRRTAGAVAGVAAAVALVVPIATFATHTSGRPEPALVVTPTPTPSPSETAKDGQQPPPGVLDASDLPTGPAPAFDYVKSGDLQFHDGGTGTVHTQHTPSLFAAMDDGSRVWQTRDRQGHAFIEIQDSDGVFHAPVPSADGLEVNREHNTAAWVSPSGQVMVWSGRATEPRPLGDPVPGGHDIRIAAIESQDCTRYCTVYVNGPATGTDVWQPYAVTQDGTRKYLDGGLRTVDAVADGLTVGKSRLTDTGSCSDLFGGGEFPGFHTCGAQFESFSPDAATLLGLPTYYDGLGPTSLSMWDVAGQKLFER